MKNLADKKIVEWLDKTETITVDPLGHLVIEDKTVLEAIAGGASMHDLDVDETLGSTGGGCSCSGAGC